MRRISELSQSRSFITGSSFEGAYDSSRECMHSFGCYEFPDGSTYRGYFQNGLFQGYGALKLVAPIKMTILGFFERGHLVKISKMIFNDGLVVTVEPKSNSLVDFSSWTFCSTEDRCFLKEISNGLQAVGPSAIISQGSQVRDLLPGNYDVQEGVFNEKNGFIFDREKPFTPLHFVSCSKKTEWIKGHCRASRGFGEVVEPNKAFSLQINETNIQSQLWCENNFGDQCSDGQKQGHKYFSKLYKMELEKAKKAMNYVEEKYEKIAVDKSSTKSSSSFQYEKPKEQICGKL